jgi:hypothetical protein
VTSQSLELERTTIVDSLGNELPISVMSKDRLEELTRLYPHPFRPRDVHYCAERAHTIGDTLAKSGIETQKLAVWPKRSWLGGVIHPYQTSLADPDTKHSPNWYNHVVNLIEVKDGDQAPSLYVIDTAVSALPIPQKQWEEYFYIEAGNARTSSIGSTAIMNRVKYDPKEANSPVSEYDPSMLEYAYQVMAGNDGKKLDH